MEKFLNGLEYEILKDVAKEEELSLMDTII